ncbi:hypothetical protein WDW86_01490 [Bdellovibrionota bacterium FG-2]
MAAEQDDFTGIGELLKRTRSLEASESIAAEPSPFSQENPSETIDHFESIEELSRTSPPPSEAPGAPPEVAESLELPDFQTSEAPNAEYAETAVAEPPPFEMHPELEPTAPTEQADATLAAPESLHDTPVPEALKQVRKFSENLASSVKPQVSAAFPFNLRIEGALSPSEKEKVLELISREDFGLREIDLEPQLEADRILIPRISEYAGVLLVQALRGSTAKMRLEPSDQMSDQDNDNEPSQSTYVADVDLSQADSLPITTSATLPELPEFKVIGVFSASAALESSVVEAHESSEYQETLEALEREIKHKACRKFAQGLVSYKIQLLPLAMPTQYRLTVSATAVTAKT